MSDTSQGSGWWQASDGKWYGPELHPDSSTLAPSSSGNTGSVPEAGKDLEDHTSAQVVAHKQPLLPPSVANVGVHSDWTLGNRAVQRARIFNHEPGTGN